MKFQIHKPLSVPVVLLVCVLLLNWLLIAVDFHEIQSERVVSVKVINGLTGQTMTLESSVEINSLISECNKVTPLLWFGPRCAGYSHYLRFYDATGKEVASFTVIDTGTVSMGQFTLVADCTGILQYLQTLEQK